MFKANNLKKYVGEEHTAEINALLSDYEESKVKNVTLKNPRVALFLSIFLGFLGIDRLYQGGFRMMGVKLLAMIFTFGTWYIADIYYTAHTVRQDNYNKLLMAANI